MSVTHQLDLTRFIRAPRARVFEAFMSEAGFRAWMGPRGLTLPEVAVDARVGGRYRVAMQARDGDRFVVGGEYREIQRPDRVVFTWQWEGAGMPGLETIVSVTLVERDGGTEVRLTHSGFPDAGMRDAHTQGWRSSLNRLVDNLDERGSAASVVLLGVAASTYVRTARMGLAEKGLAYTFEQSAPHSPPIDAIHPWGKVPAFRDGDIELFETSAILRYVDESFPGAKLAGGGILDRARAEQWVSAINSYCYQTMVSRYVLQYVFPRGADGKPDRAVIDAAAKEMEPQLATFERAYAGRDYLVGNNLTIADLFLAPIVAYLGGFPESAALLERSPNIRRAHAAIAARPSFKSTMPQG